MKVFLSHASEDETVATEVCLALRGAGHTVFFDAQDLPPGADYNTRIRDAVGVSDALVFLVSPYSVEPGGYTLTELKFAKQKWQSPWGHVLPVVIKETKWRQIDPYLASVTVLKPVGNIAAEVVDALVRIAESPEAMARSARLRSPIFALQAVLIGAMVVAWILMALVFGVDASPVRWSAVMVIAVFAITGSVVAATGAANRARDASIRSLIDACHGVARRPWFAVLSAALAAAATGVIAWQSSTLNFITFLASQDVELILSDKVGEARSLGTLKAGAQTRVLLPTGTRRIAYREVGGASTEIGVLNAVDVPPLWSRTEIGVIEIPRLDRYGTLR